MKFMAQLLRKSIGVSVLVAAVVAITSCTEAAMPSRKLELQSRPSFASLEQLANMPARAGKLIQFELLEVGGVGDGMPRYVAGRDPSSNLSDRVLRLLHDVGPPPPLTPKLLLTYTVRARNTTKREALIHLQGSVVECGSGHFYMESATKSRIVNSLPRSDEARDFNGAEDKVFAVPDGIAKLAPLEARDIQCKTEVYMPDEEYPPRPTRLLLEFGVEGENVDVVQDCSHVIYGL